MHFLLPLVSAIALVFASSAPVEPASSSTVAAAFAAPVTTTVTYTCTASVGQIQVQDANGNWVTLMNVQKGHVFVTDTAQEGNFRFLPETPPWTRTEG
jgi:hypothetical protein